MPKNRAQGSVASNLDIQTETRWLNPVEPIRKAIIQKAKRYGRPDLPFVIAVNALAEGIEDDEVSEVLFGDEQWVSVAGDQELRFQRKANGLGGDAVRFLPPRVALRLHCLPLISQGTGFGSRSCGAFVSLGTKQSGERGRMGLFGTLMNKIFHASANAEAPVDARQPAQSSESRVAAAARTGLPVGVAVPGGGAPASIDIAATLDRMAAAHPEKLDWKHSIVDLMKLVGMDSSLAQRKELAADLKYTGDTNDSAAMNMWLHKEVMRRLAENGGKVPPALLTH